MSNHDIDKLIEKGKEMLKALSNNKSVDSEVFNTNIIALKQIIALNPELRKEVGALIQELISTKKLYDIKSDLVQVPVLQGRISIGHRPKFKVIPFLKREGITHVLTLLSRREGAEKIGESVRKSELEWIWHPMENATPPSSDQYEGYMKLFKKLQRILESRGSIYIHCSAGIHRTGMIVFAFLLYLGYSELEAKEALVKLREVTHENIGVERLEWGKYLLKYKENQK